MSEEKKKAFELVEKKHEKMKKAVTRIVDFITEDKIMMEMTPRQIKSVFNMAYGTIFEAAIHITLGQICDIHTQSVDVVAQNIFNTINFKDGDKE